MLANSAFSIPASPVSPFSRESSMESSSLCRPSSHSPCRRRRCRTWRAPCRFHRQVHAARTDPVVTEQPTLSLDEELSCGNGVIDALRSRKGTVAVARVLHCEKGTRLVVCRSFPPSVDISAEVFKQLFFGLPAEAESIEMSLRENTLILAYFVTPVRNAKRITSSFVLITLSPLP